MDADTVAALTGSRAGDRLIINTWYDGALTHTDLDITDWSLDWDDTRQIKGTGSITIADPDGRLAPWEHWDDLGTGGPRVTASYQVGGAGTINMGEFVISSADPVEEWTHYPAGTVRPDLLLVSAGGTVPIGFDDLTEIISADRFAAPESPKGDSPTVFSELYRLTDGIVPLVVADGVTDRSISQNLIYDDEKDRLGALEDLAGMVSAGLRCTADGLLEVYHRKPLAKLVRSDAVAELAPGPDGVLIRVRRKLTRDGLFNGWFSDGADGNQFPVRSAYLEPGGPMRWDGPLGRRPEFHSSTELIKTQSQAFDDALRMRSDRVGSQAVALEVTCLPNPALEVGDVVLVAAPVVDGRPAPVVGRVVKMSLGMGEAMTLTVEADYTVVAAARKAATRS